jgi:hypothetical protein
VSDISLNRKYNCYDKHCRDEIQFHINISTHVFRMIEVKLFPTIFVFVFRTFLSKKNMASQYEIDSKQWVYIELVTDLLIYL